MLRSWWRQAFVVVLFLLIASCTGGGCSSGCSSCGIAPIAGGFDPTQTIANSASVRVTKPGLEFLSTNLPSLAATLLPRSGQLGEIDFDVPTTTSSDPIQVLGITIFTVNLTICPNGASSATTPPTCIAQIEIGNAQLAINAVTAHSIQLTGTIPVKLRDLPIETNVGQIDVAVGANLSCASGGGSDADYLPFPITIDLPLVADTNPPRAGYMMIDGKNAVVNVGIQQSDIQLCSNCSSIISGVCNGVLSLITGLVFTPLQTQLNGEIQNLLTTQLCTKANSALNPPCPVGSQPEGDGGAPPLLADGGAPSSEPNCVYDTDPTTCLPIELGLEGHLNLGSLLSSISPGTTGALDFALAAGGSLNPAPGLDAGADGSTPNGISIGMLGGGLPSPQSECVPMAPNPLPTGLIIPDQMLTDKVPNWPAGDNGPDIGLALDGQFLNYMLGSAYNSGLLCLGISTEKFQQLNTGLVSVLVPSITSLTFEQKAAAIAISTRPQKPPQATIGGGTNLTTDPLLSILLPSFAIDFYVWSEDRYIRGFTFTSDVTIPVNLQSGVSATNPTGGLLPTLGALTLANPVVTNNVLITDDPKMIASSLSSVLGSLVGQIIGAGIPAINLSSALSSLGLTFNIPVGGIQKITQGSENYLGIFGDLGLPGSPLPQIETQATLVEKTVHPEAMALATLDPARGPTLHVRFASPADDGTKAVEYSWQLDQGTWSPWSTSRDVVISDTMLFMQAKHTLQVTSRVVGQMATQDLSPAVIPFTIDVLPPFVTVKQQDIGFSIDTWDVVSPTEALLGRTRGTDASGKQGEWSAWMPVAQMATVNPSFTAVDVEVRDEEGNVGQVSSQLIRGGPDPTLPTSGGCSQGCTSASHSGSSWPAIVLALAGIAALVARRRSGVMGRTGAAALALGSIVSVAASSQGCSCGSSAHAGPPVSGDAGPGVCGMGCDQACGPALPQGLIGAYTSIAQGTDGTLWVAGYNDAAIDPTNQINTLYGDLVVGKYDTTKQAVAWVTVDGLPPTLPDDVCPPNDPTGWRGGLLDSGPDVGLWTSMVLDANGNPMVSYYDATNQAVKFASSTDGKTWSTHAVYANTGADVGRYSKMVILNGMPVLAFLVIEPGTSGYSRTKVSVAHAKVALPASAADWALEDALVDEQSPCRASDCATGQACVTATGLASTGACTTVSPGCDAACGSGNACIDVSNVPTCEAVATTTDIHPYPAAVADYINLAVDGSSLGLLVYDRIHGNLLGLTDASGAWVVTILDGETGSRAAGTAVDTGDDGVGASLFISASGDWHVSYVNGITETLKYLYVPGGTLSNTLVPQTVDDGSKVDGAAFSDGIHIIGDDSNVRANSDGSVTITYMDATSGSLRLATGSSKPGTWTLHAVSQPNHFGGFFPHFEPSSSSIANWWRWADPTTQIVTGDVAVVSPQ